MSDIYGFMLSTDEIWTPELAICRAGLKVGGKFLVLVYDSHGNYKGPLRADNIIPNAVLNDILSVYYNAGAATPAFYVGMVDNAGFSAFSPTDTMASHPGWNENTAMTGAGRPQWLPVAPSGQMIQNTTATTITMSANATLKGFLLASNATLGGTTGNLAATAPITTGPAPVSAGDVLKVTYQIPATTS